MGPYCFGARPDDVDGEGRGGELGEGARTDTHEELKEVAWRPLATENLVLTSWQPNSRSCRALARLSVMGFAMDIELAVFTRRHRQPWPNLHWIRVILSTTMRGGVEIM